MISCIFAAARAVVGKHVSWRRVAGSVEPNCFQFEDGNSPTVPRGSNSQQCS